jgi:hypothetical protein
MLVPFSMQLQAPPVLVAAHCTSKVWVLPCTSQLSVQSQAPSDVPEQPVLMQVTPEPVVTPALALVPDVVAAPPPPPPSPEPIMSTVTLAPHAAIPAIAVAKANP